MPLQERHFGSADPEGKAAEAANGHCDQSRTTEPTKVATNGSRLVQDRTKLRAIVVLGGAFCPVHCGHIEALMAAKRHAEKHGFEVVGAYLAVAPDGYTWNTE